MLVVTRALFRRVSQNGGLRYSYVSELFGTSTTVVLHLYVSPTKSESCVPKTKSDFWLFQVLYPVWHNDRYIPFLPDWGSFSSQPTSNHSQYLHYSVYAVVCNPDDEPVATLTEGMFFGGATVFVACCMSCSEPWNDRVSFFVRNWTLGCCTSNSRCHRKDSLPNIYTLPRAISTFAPGVYMNSMYIWTS